MEWDRLGWDGIRVEGWIGWGDGSDPRFMKVCTTTERKEVARNMLVRYLVPGVKKASAAAGIAVPRYVSIPVGSTHLPCYGRGLPGMWHQMPAVTQGRSHCAGLMAAGTWVSLRGCSTHPIAAEWRAHHDWFSGVFEVRCSSHGSCDQLVSAHSRAQTSDQWARSNPPFERSSRAAVTRSAAADGVGEFVEDHGKDDGSLEHR